MAANWSHTSFSGSHQDAIKKGFAAQESRTTSCGVPYLPIDPADLGRSYEAVIRVNSQSGKGGFAWVLEQDQGLKLPKKMQAHFSKPRPGAGRRSGPRTVQASDIWDVFQRVYKLNTPQHFQLVDYEETRRQPTAPACSPARSSVDGKEQSVSGRGNGLISSVVATLATALACSLRCKDYTEHAMTAGSDARAAAYVECGRRMARRSGASASTRTCHRQRPRVLSAPTLYAPTAVSRFLPTRATWLPIVASRA
jgi:2-isopropylmalate synthase